MLINACFAQRLDMSELAHWGYESLLMDISGTYVVSD